MSDATANPAPKPLPVYTERQASAACLLPYVPPSARRILLGNGADPALVEALHATPGRFVAGVLPPGHDSAAGLDAVYHAWDPWPLHEDAGEFDVIVLFDCVEHWPAPPGHLARLREQLQPGGLLLLVLPNIQFADDLATFADGRWPYTDASDMRRHPLRFFTAGEIGRLVREAGYDLLRLRPLTMATPEELPRDGEGMIHRGRVSIGPLNDTDYNMLRTMQYIALATRPAAG